MDYHALLQGVAFTGQLPRGEATLVTQDSRRVEKGAVFVCIKGDQADGHDYASKALEKGAGLLVTQRPLGLPCEVVVSDTRTVYACLCQQFFGHPAQKLTLVAVTGTNGKTTVSTILRQILEINGVSCGLIGSVQSEIGPMKIPAKYTTPEAWDLAALMSRMVEAGCTHLVMEASSQAIAQERLAGLRFALSIFTNLTQDHLDYHGTMEAYYQAKRRLFAQSDAMLVNLDDPWGQRLLEEVDLPNKKTYAVQNHSADYLAHNLELRADGVKFGYLGGEMLHPVFFPMPGEYSVYNALAAASAALMLGQNESPVAAALSNVQGVSGRCEVVYSGSFTVIRDFAHTGDAIEKLLSALRPFAKNNLVVLYGCAGERDAEKRPRMSEAALRYGDVFFLTSDNPRNEDPMKIIRNALPPLEASGRPFTVEPDRENAVRLALDSLQEGDLLVLCGKGHEDYQVLNGKTVYLNEKQLVRRHLHR